MFNFKKPLAFITSVICSTICLHHCSALERNELGIITALTKDATIGKKISEACLAYREYADKLNAEPELVEILMNAPYGTVISLNKNDTDFNTYYDEILKGNFGLKWAVMHYIAKLLQDADIRADLWCFYDGKFKPSVSVKCKDISDLLYHCLVVYGPDGEALHTFSFNVRSNDLKVGSALDTPKLDDEKVGSALDTPKLDDEAVGREVPRVYIALIAEFKRNGIKNITMTCTDPATGEFKPLPPEIPKARNYARAMYDLPNIGIQSYKNVFYVSDKGELTSL